MAQGPTFHIPDDPDATRVVPDGRRFDDAGIKTDAGRLLRRGCLFLFIIPFLCTSLCFISTGVDLTLHRVREGEPLFRPVETPPPGTEEWYPLPTENADNLQVGITLGLVVVFLVLTVVLFAVRTLSRVARRRQRR